MKSLPDHVEVEDNAIVDADLIPIALTAGRFWFEDGATQIFSRDGTTTYTERARPSDGTWYVDNGSFCSFWPPSYTGCYNVTWLVENEEITGLRFVDRTNGASFIGRYE